MLGFAALAEVAVAEVPSTPGTPAPVFVLGSDSFAAIVQQTEVIAYCLAFILLKITY